MCSIKKRPKRRPHKKSEGEGVGGIGTHTNRNFDMQDMRERISKNRKEGNNENVLNRMSDNQQERKHEFRNPEKKPPRISKKYYKRKKEMRRYQEYRKTQIGKEAMKGGYEEGA